MNQTTFAARLIALTASAVVTFALFQWVAELGDDARADRLAQAELAKAAVTAPKERL
ncbi:MAG TPA: hypothetical protein VLW55_28655 [Burkholderiaceae bacterium]|nr:hypothetical protein [Burkholderiaceae bacterium]